MSFTLMLNAVRCSFRVVKGTSETATLMLNAVRCSFRVVKGTSETAAIDFV